MSFAGALFIVIVCGVMPWMAIRTARELRRHRLRVTTRQVLLSTLVTHGGVGLLAVWVAWVDGIELFPALRLQWTDAVAGAALLLLAVLSNVWRWEVLGPEDREELTWFRPRSARDLVPWLGVSLLAGVSEEIIYRGVLLGVAERALGSSWIAVAVCVAAFTLGHWAQGRGAMLIIVGFAFAFHVLVQVTGDLYTAMAVHALYDFGAGVALLAMGRSPRPSPPPGPPGPSGIVP